MKFTLIDPAKCWSGNPKAPRVVIEFVPMLKRNVGIGYVIEEEATAKDFAKYPVLDRPWINPKAFNK